MNDKNLMKAINCRVIPVEGYVMNVCNLRKDDLDELDMTVKSVLWREGFHGRQSSDERLYLKRNEGVLKIEKRIEKFQRGLQRNKNLNGMLHGCSNK